MRSLLVGLLLLAPLALAYHPCTTWTTSAPFAEAAGHYLIFECGFQCDGFSVWIYEEANDIPGLQRGDEVHDDTCHGMIPSDRIVF